MNGTCNLIVEDVVKYYSQRVKESSRFSSVKKTVKAVDGVSFSMEKGDILGIIGESGCGKSTLAKLLIHLESPTAGKIYFNGTDADQLMKRDRMAFKRMIQMVFQNPFDTFDPRNRIEKIITDTLAMHNIGNNYDERISKALDAMESIGLTPVKDYLYRFPHELSGGQLQRISILRAMMLKPQFLLADEPVSMLDVSVRADIIKMLKGLVENEGASLIFISHDINTTRYISNKVAVMYLGRIVEAGETDSVLHNPCHPYTRVLISNCASVDLSEKKEVIRIKGEPPTPIDNGPGCYFAPRCYQAKDICFKEYPQESRISENHVASCHFI